jgi:hypothetical protein
MRRICSLYQETNRSMDAFRACVNANMAVAHRLTMSVLALRFRRALSALSLVVRCR